MRRARRRWRAAPSKPAGRRPGPRRAKRCSTCRLPTTADKESNVAARRKTSVLTRRLTCEEADDETKNQLPRGAGREEDGQTHKRNLAATLEDLEPKTAKFIARSQLLQHGGELRAQTVVLVAALVTSSLCPLHHLGHLILSVRRLRLQLGNLKIRLDPHFYEPQLAQLVAVAEQ
eukprot:6775236-Prymnesium_polylepis.1